MLLFAMRGALCGHWHPMKPQPHPASNLPVCNHDCHQKDNMNKKLCVMHSCTQDETRIDYLRCSTCLLFDFHNFSSCFMSSLTTPEALRANKKSQKSFIYMILRDFHMIFYETPMSRDALPSSAKRSRFIGEETSFCKNEFQKSSPLGFEPTTTVHLRTYRFCFSPDLIAPPYRSPSTGTYSPNIADAD